MSPLELAALLQAGAALLAAAGGVWVADRAVRRITMRASARAEPHMHVHGYEIPRRKE